MNIGIDIRALATKNRSGIGNYVLNSIKNIIKLDKTNNYYLLSSGGEKIKELINIELEYLLRKNLNLHHIHLRFSNKILNLSISL